MEHIVFLDSNTLIADLRLPKFAHQWESYPATSPGEVASRLNDATIAITNKVALRREILDGLPKLGMIAVAATGTDHIDLACCKERGIVVSNIRNYSVHTVPEHVFMMLLALRRNLFAFHGDIRGGEWQKAKQFCLFTHPVMDLYGSTLGIVGHGAIGRAVEGVARAFGMQVLVAEHKGVAGVRPGYTPFHEVLERSDAITLHLPLNDATRNMIGEAEFKRMKQSALLINTARGGLVEEKALRDALLSGRIAGAGFDVLSKEPPLEGNPLLEIDLPNFILTPHIAWSGRSAMQTLADQLIDNIESFVAGNPVNRVA